MDSAVAWGARAVLAVVLVAAAAGKLRDRTAARSATVALVGERFGPAVAFGLPFVEIGLAVALVAWWSPVPGIVTAAVLLAFTALLVRARTRGLPCPCFGGRLAAAPVGGGAVLRNGALVALAILATATP